MIKLNYRFLSVLLLLMTFMSSYAQWNCRSKVASNLKPFHEKVPVYWATEETFGHGWMNDRMISNIIVYGALDVNIKKHHLYYDVGFKWWRNEGFDERDGDVFNKDRFGYREIFYMYSGPNMSLNAGLHTVELGDYFLINERAWGLSYKHKFSGLDISISTGSVLKGMARNGTFCSVYYLYNVIPGREYNYLGEAFGETNFAGGVVKWNPAQYKQKKDAKKESEDEFSEFESFEEEKEPLVDEFGLVFYEEFGTGILEEELYYGLLAGFNLPLNFGFRVQLMNQQIGSINTGIYHVRLDQRFNVGKGGRAEIFAGYYGKIDMDTTVAVASSFNNLFLGEVLRLDAADMPMYQIAGKYSFTKVKFSIKAQYISQIAGDNMNEIDIELHKYFFKHLGVATIFSRFDAETMENEMYMGRIELRATF